MGIHAKILIFPFLLFAAFLTSCGDENDSNKIEVEQIAEKPVVINSDFTIDPTPSDSDSGDEIEIKGPWFPVRFFGSNPTDRDLTIATFVITVTGRDENGQEVTGDWTLDLGNSPFLLVADAGSDFELTGTAFVDGLPESINSRYRVTMEFTGWFNKTIDDPNTTINESTQPDESFRKVISFTTQ